MQAAACLLQAVSYCRESAGWLNGAARQPRQPAVHCAALLLQVAIAAKEHSVPMYVAAESYKFAR